MMQMMETEDTGRIRVIFSCLVLAMLLVWVISGGFRSFASNMAEEAFWYIVDLVTLFEIFIFCPKIQL